MPGFHVLLHVHRKRPGVCKNVTRQNNTRVLSCHIVSGIEVTRQYNTKISHEEILFLQSHLPWSSQAEWCYQGGRKMTSNTRLLADFYYPTWCFISEKALAEL